MQAETIYALSSGSLPSGVAVIRLSGPDVRFAIETFAGTLPPPRTAVLRSIRLRNGAILDRGLVLHFPAPHSFTGEEVAEFHLHGSRAVVAAFLEALSELANFRHAEAGEFSRRAFENGRMDLTEVEGLGDLIAAQTEMQRRLAVQQAAGGLTAIYEGWADRLTHLRAMIEADLDFGDEDDVPEDAAAGYRSALVALRDEMTAHLAKAAVGAIIRDGFQIVIAGAVNAGKSSLINRLAERDIAIVSDEAGTTRDVLSVDLDIGGYAVTVSDTAGFRSDEDAGGIEREGMARARRRIETADLVLHLVDLTDPRSASGGSLDAVLAALPRERVLTIGSKADLVSAKDRADRFGIEISAITGSGIDELVDRLKAIIEARASFAGEAIPSRARQRDALAHCVACVDEAISAPERLELVAECLRQAGDALGRITGRVDAEGLLDVIFRQFCIGK